MQIKEFFFLYKTCVLCFSILNLTHVRVKKTLLKSKNVFTIFNGYMKIQILTTHVLKK